MRLLLLENRSAFAERLAAALSAGGQAECECASLSAFERRETNERAYDALVLDLRRDAKNGLRLCRRVVRRASDKPVIAVTALDDHNEAIRMVQAGAEDVCLRDEFDADTLLTRIRCAIQRYQTSAMMANEICAAAPAAGGLGALGGGPEGMFAGPGATLDEQAIKFACIIAPGLESSAASEPAWTESLGVPVEITHLDEIYELTEHVTATPTDAVLMYMNELNADGLDAIATTRVHRENAIVVVAAPDFDGDLAVKAIQHGADDFVASDRPSHETVSRYVRQGIARRKRQAGIECDAEDSPKFQQRQSHFQQRSPRYYVTKSAIAIPIRPDLKPNQSVRVEGFTVDVSESGIGFEIGALDQLPSELLLAGVEGDDGLLYFATVEVRNLMPKEGRSLVGAQFVTGERDLIRPENLTPTFQPETHEFETRLPQETLMDWVELGIFRPVLFDRIFVCPKCGGMPTFRSGCRSCGSIHVASHQLIHHFECSYLGRINEFEKDGTVACPKCGVDGAVDGDEFELLNGPCHCLECNWSDSDMEVVGQCMQCNWHFPLKNASERELVGYHVNRLDPQALLGIS